MLLSLSATAFADSSLVQDGTAIYAESDQIPQNELYAAAKSFYEGTDLAALVNEEIGKGFGKWASNKKFETSIDEASICYLLDETLLSDVEEPITLTSGKHSFGIRFDYTSSYSYKEFTKKKSGTAGGTYTASKPFTFSVRLGTQISVAKDRVSYVWGDEDPTEALMAELQPVVTLRDGTPIDGAQVYFVEKFAKNDAGEYTLTLRYDGRDGVEDEPGYMPSTAQVALTIRKAATSVEVVSSTVAYDGKEHFVEVNVSPASVPYTAITVGLQGDASGFASIYMSEGNALYKALVFLRDSGDTLNFFAKLIGIDISDFIIGSEGVSLEQLRTLLTNITELSNLLTKAGIILEDSEINGILQALNAIEKVMPDLNVRFYIKNMPKNEGLYLTYAVASDVNHETATDFGYTTIAPNMNVSLQWNQSVGSYSFDRHNADRFDYTAKMYDNETQKVISAPISYKFTGVTAGGKTFSGNGLDEKPTEPGTYTETAYSLYNYVASVSRIYTINRDSAYVKFVDSDGKYVDTLTLTDDYDGQGKTVFAVVVDGEGNVIDGAKVTYSYSGKTKAGKTYLSSSAPSNSGTYTVRASFAGDALYNPASNNSATITINKAEASITFDNVTTKVLRKADVKSVGYTYKGMTSDEAAAIAATLKSPFSVYLLIGTYKMSVSIPAEIAEQYDVTVSGGKITVKLF